MQRPPVRMAAILGLLLAFADGPAQAQRDTALTRLVEINTTQGALIVALYNDTPIHRDNFLKLVRNGFYDSTLIHRVVPGFMVQAGDPDSKHADDRTRLLGSGGPQETLPAEIRPGAIHRKGVLAAARQDERTNPDRRSSTSQFFLVHGRTYRPSDLERLLERRRAQSTDSIPDYTTEQKDIYWTEGGAPHLDGAYTIFGEIVEGLDVLDKIAAMPTDAMDRPLTDVRIWMSILP